MELHAIKGVGKDHAKWSPVGAYYERRGVLLRLKGTDLRGLATATYRLHPLIVLNPSKPVPPTPRAEIRVMF